LATIKDIARKAGVSVATVSFVLNNNPGVTEDKRKRVLDAVKELNYVPNAVARGLRVQRTETIGFVVSDITNPFYPDLVKACERKAQKEGYTITVQNTDDRADRTQQALRQLREGKVDGIILTSALEQDRAFLSEMIEQGHPIVMAGRRIEGVPIDSVVADNGNGAHMATRHLQRLGHVNIAFMPGITGSSITRERMNGYIQAMSEAGLPVDPDWLVSGAARYAESYEAAKRLLALPGRKRPTAIINLTDIGALGVLDAAKDMQVSVPNELAVVGFDDLFMSGMRSIQLTTVRVPTQQMGEIATELLLDKIKKRTTGEPREIVLPVELIVRSTCGGKDRI